MSLHSILVVDDNTDMLLVYERILAQEGFEVYTAASGAECLKLVESVTPQIVLMDVVLPDWNGIDLVRELKDRPEFANSIFVLLSGLQIDSESKIQGLNAGALDYLSRPIPNKELLAKVKSLVKVMDFQESLVELSMELDQRVAERTRMLEETVAALRREIENRKQAEEQFRQSQKMEAIGTLAGGIAHDFNNILTVIQGNLYLRKLGDKERGKISPEIDQIGEAVERAASLTRGLLAFSRRQVLDARPVSLSILVQQSVKLGSRMVEESISIIPELCPDVLMVSADAGLIQQALFNLFTNARDAMNSQGTINVRTAREDIMAAALPPGYFTPASPAPGAYAVIQVHDSGAGIPPEDMERIFEPFFTTKESGKGTGLGLAMIHGTIVQHNGFISVESLPGKGTRFSIYLPLQESAQLAEVLTDRPIASAAMLAGHTVLVVEDDGDVRDLLVMVLTNYGSSVLTAENGTQAVDVFRENRDRISLVLMDAIMPEMNGQEALNRIRMLAPDTPCIFLSGHDEEFLNRLNIARQSAIIRKPFSMPDLLRSICAILECN